MRASTMAALRKPFESTLRAILGVGHHANGRAVHRELGWTNMNAEFVRARMSLVKSILSQQSGRLQKELLRRRYAGMRWNGRGGWALRHERLKGSGKRHSYFLASLINIFVAMGQGALLHTISCNTWTRSRIVCTNRSSISRLNAQYMSPSLKLSNRRASRRTISGRAGGRCYRIYPR